MTSHWFPKEEFEQPRIADDYYERVMRMFKSRAMFWRSVSICLLAFTCLSIIVGAIVFVVGYPQNRLLAETERQLLQKRVGVRASLRAMDEELEQAKGNFSRLKSANVLATSFRNLRKTLVNYKANHTPGAGNDLESLLGRCIQVLDNLKKADALTETIVIDLPGQKSFTPDAFQELKKQATQAEFDTVALHQDVQNVSDHFAAEKAKVTADMTPDDLEKLEFYKAFQESKAMTRAESLDSSISDKLSKAATKLEEYGEQTEDRGRKKRGLESELAKVNQELKDLDEERNKILFMAWLPDLTIRVGAVALLLFLTQILLATYRYTMALSAFYLARADAVQLLQPLSQEDSGYRAKEFAELVACLSPAHSIEGVASPTDRLADLVQAWIGRFPSRPS